MDTLYFDLEFVDQDKVWAETKVSKEDFFMAEGINLTCDYNLSYRNDFKFRTKEYEFELLPDTILNNKSLRQYKLKYIGKRKRKKSFPVGSNTYIIKDSTAFHLPILTHSTAFEEWEINKKIPNGIFSEKIFYDYQNNIEYKFILKNCYKIKKSIIVPEDCLEQ
ncbi:hypothetical protein [Gramella sp. Hel_I_59]|uniref:hypothetical protein n=1 Tax=Gramella sp. Hel_I_59 TaxID=1249978 RepID=UPI00114DCB07|nr:hypothetical protein [Gramella sp. Hel_I_59]